MGKFRQLLTALSAAIRPYFRLRTITLSNINGFSPNLVCALILWKSGLGLLMDKFPHFFDIVIYPPHDSGWVSAFHVFVYANSLCVRRKTTIKSRCEVKFSYFSLKN